MSRLTRLCEWMAARRYRCLLVALGLLLASPSLLIGLQTDDLMIRGAALRLSPAPGVRRGPWEAFTFMNGDPAQNHALMDKGYVPWWMYPRARAAFARPLTALTHLFDFRVLDAFPALMHVHNLAWFALLLWSAATLYRRLLSGHLDGPAPGQACLSPGERPPAEGGRVRVSVGGAAAAQAPSPQPSPQGRGSKTSSPSAPRLSGESPAWAAALAALLFTFDNGHAWPAGWLSNRNALIAGAFGFVALIAHDRWRREGWRPGAALAPLALAAALLAKEEALGVGAYLLAYALFLDGAPWRRRLAALLPCALVGAAWCTAYKALGFGVVGSAMYVDPTHAPLRFASWVARNAPLLLTAQWAFPEADLSSMLSPAAFRALWLWAAGVLALLAVALWPLLRRARVARFWALGMLLSVVPVCAAFPMNRLLMFPGLGAMGLLALWLAGRSARAEWLPKARAWRGLARALAALFVALHLVLAPLLFPIRTAGIWFIGKLVAAHYAALDPGPEAAGQSFIFVNPAASSHMLWMITRARAGLPLPERCLNLGPSSAPIAITRTDERTLVVRPAAGYLLPLGASPVPGEPPPAFSFAHMVRFFDILFRGPAHPMRLGDKVELTPATVEVTALTPDGRPAEATFRFRVPLDDPSLRWFACRRGQFQPFTPPPVGQAIHVPSALE
ncbi:MAG: hypothetical protein FJ291_12355 [Planctomycetes bacterium]|nr:hypothetical protein [Planctomycetota bacterium]